MGTMNISKEGLVLASVLLCAGVWSHGPRTIGGFDPGPRRPIDLVICLDTSNSMDHLIDSARAKLWEVVTQLSQARPEPYLRVGLLTYGSPGVSTAAAGWVVRQIDLSDDLDLLYSRLMALRTNGGDEFVGWVLRDAVQTMNWSPDPSALKMIFVAGNESADQGSSQVNFRNVAEQAKVKGIAINALFCGPEEIGRNDRWADVALYGGGAFTAIDMACGTLQIQTPFDRELIELNVQLNATYVPFGRVGEAGERRQRDQDAASEKMGIQTEASRVAAKATGVYQNAQWDLVDASTAGDFRLEAVAETELPTEMQRMNKQERAQHLETKRARRSEVQKKIQDAGSRRDEFLQKQSENAAGGKQSLDAALRQITQQQAEKKGFTFEKQ